MSPMLQAEVAHNTHRQFLVNVWYLKECSNDFVAQVARHLKASMFCPREAAVHKTPHLYIVLRGLVGRFGRVLRKGRVYGEDFILNNPQLRMDARTIAITYVETLSIERTSFLTLVKEASPEDAGEVRFGHFQLAVIR